MTVILKRTTIKDFIPPIVYPGQCPTENKDSFRVYALIENPLDDNTNSIRADIQALSQEDVSSALKTYIKIFQRVGQGQPLINMFDKTQYHKGHEFDYDGKHISIWRFWLAGSIRVYFINYDKNLFILNTIAKRKDDLNKAEKNVLEQKVKKIIVCKKKNKIQIEDKL